MDFQRGNFSSQAGGNFVKDVETNFNLFWNGRKRCQAITVLSADEEVLSSEFHSILVSHFRGGCTQLARAGMRERNGLQLWRDLRRECMPTTRQPGLALAQALATYPSFNSQKSFYRRFFIKVSGPEELKSATLLRCIE